jgi:hypothetical protein
MQNLFGIFFCVFTDIGYGIGLQVIEIKKKLRDLSPQVNYIDRATAACRRSWCQLLWIEVVA